jgi:outer membrane protein insertion porin family
MLKRLVITILIGSLALSSFAQQGGEGGDSEWYLNRPIVEVTFEGLDSISRSELQGIVEPYIGEEFTNDRFLELQRRLYALDYFSEIVPEAVRPQDDEGMIINFTVTERPLVDEIVFEGNASVRANDLLNEITLSRGDIITQSKLDSASQAITELYQEKGFPEVSVETATEDLEETKDQRVVFEIEEGNQVTIREIRFSGNSFASDSTLRGTIESSSQSIFNRGIYQESKLEQDRNAIERYYRQRGFVDAEVTDVNTEFEYSEEEERTFATITFFVEEGEQYRFGGISFDGNTIFTDEELAERVRIEEGDLLNMSQLESDFQRVADVYYQNGYIFNSITREENRNENQNRITYTVNIVERGRAHIENIIIRGNEKTKDHVIRREIPLEVGEVFSATKIRQGMQNLSNLQYFSNITPETPQGSVPGLMDLVLNVEEANTADIRFGIAFGGNQDFPISGQISWQDRNFLGRGQTIGAELNVSPVNQRLSFNFREPWLFGERWSGGINLSVDRSRQSDIPQDIQAPVFQGNEDNAVPDPFDGHCVFRNDTNYEGNNYDAGDPFPGDLPDDESCSDIEEYDLVTDYQFAGGTTSAIPEENLMEYNIWNISLGGSTGYRFVTPVGRLDVGTDLSTSIEYANYDRQIYRPFSSNIRQNWREWQFVNRWGFNTSLDTRDLIISPSSGYYLRQELGLTGGFLFGSKHFIRTKTRGEGYLTLFDIPVFDNWNWKMVGAAHSAISFIFPQFWAPQAERLDAEPSRDFLFIDGMFNARGWNRITGGKALWTNWLELRMPLAEQVIWFDQFIDAAALYQERDQIGQLGIENMLFSAGFGVRFTIPQFPIRLYLAKRFQIDDGQIDWKTGSLFNPDNEEGQGLEFVFSIGTELF